MSTVICLQATVAAVGRCTEYIRCLCPVLLCGTSCWTCANTSASAALPHPLSYIMLFTHENSEHAASCLQLAASTASALGAAVSYTSITYANVCRFFPSVFYLSTSKVAIAVLGNMAFALALTLYNLTTKVCRHSNCVTCVSLHKNNRAFHTGVLWLFAGVRTRESERQDQSSSYGDLLGHDYFQRRVQR